MFQAQQLVFYTCVSPVHMGAGSAVGAIDNPIQREVHTGYPLIASFGLKGAVRHHFQRSWTDKLLITRIFGPETNASEHAGAIAFTDAQLVAFRCNELVKAMDKGQVRE